jgi:hypothetical protein
MPLHYRWKLRRWNKRRPAAPDVVPLLRGGQRGGTARKSCAGRTEEILYAPSCADVVIVAATID